MAGQAGIIPTENNGAPAMHGRARRRPTMSYQKYIDMQKWQYELDVPSEEVVGSYEWNEGFPYETHLLYINGDVRYPIFADPSDKIALDFACGPGRMIPRMSKYFARVDGVDISDRLVADARAANPASNFWVTAGDDLGEAPSSTYDFVYSTIAMQHVAVHSIRMKILREIARVLKPGGCINIQYSFNWRFPYSRPGREVRMGKKHIVVYEREDDHARWREDRVDAKMSNGICDVGIGRGDLDDVRADTEKLFRDVKMWFHDITHVGRGPKGMGDPRYSWSTHMLFVHGVKRDGLVQ
jgi:SAM-dependent methyltransferase